MEKGITGRARQVTTHFFAVEGRLCLFEDLLGRLRLGERIKSANVGEERNLQGNIEGQKLWNIKILKKTRFCGE